MSKGSKYLVVSTGNVVGELSRNAVLSNLCDAFSIDLNQAHVLLKANSIIKQSLSLPIAQDIQSSFNQLGLVTELVAETTTVNDSQSEPPASGQSSSDYKTKADFVALMKGELPKVTLPTSYKLGLLGGSLLSLVAPLLYFGIVSGLIYGIFWYIDLLPSLWSELSKITAKILAAVIPLFVSVVLLLFLLKPLFARQAKAPQYEVMRHQAPALFNLVEVMCQKMAVPTPTTIVLDTQVNASASPKEGLSSLLRGEFTLTVGLPLVAGMNVRQLIGVLAHEFGHFSQRSAMLAHYLVNGVNYWFASRAYEPDEWDQRLDAWSEKASWHYFGTMTIGAAKSGIFLTRLLFSGLCRLNHVLTQYMSRSMEYHADSYESIFAGSEQFESNALCLRRLAYAEQQVMLVNRSCWQDNQLLNDIPAAIASIVETFSDELETKIKQDMKNSKIDAYSSHPADNDRIRHAKRRKDPGIIDAAFPAHQLWNDFSTLSQYVTLFTYNVEGIESPAKLVVDNQQILNSEGKKQDASDALSCYFNDSYPDRFLQLELPEHQHERNLALQDVLFMIENVLLEYRENNAMYQHFLTQRSAVLEAQVYVNNNISINPRSYSLRGGEPSDVEVKIRALYTQLKEKKQQVSKVDRLFYLRLLKASDLMETPTKLSFDAKVQQLRSMAGLAEAVAELQSHYAVLMALLDNDDAMLANLSQDITNFLNRCVRGANSIAQQSRSIQCDKEGYASLDAFIGSWVGCLPIIVNQGQAQHTAESCRKVIAAVMYHYYGLFADVCEQALAQEKRAGILPLQLV